MRSYGGPTPKRHVLYANSPAIQSLYKGRLVGWSKHIKAQDAAGVARVKTVDKYVDKSGQVRYKGSKGLRPSESETYLLQNVIFQTAMFNYILVNLKHQSCCKCFFTIFSLARSGITLRHLVRSWCPSTSDWSLRNMDCLAYHHLFPQQRNVSTKCSLTIHGRMPKWYLYVIGYVVERD